MRRRRNAQRKRNLRLGRVVAVQNILHSISCKVLTACGQHQLAKSSPALPPLAIVIESYLSVEGMRSYVKR